MREELSAIHNPTFDHTPKPPLSSFALDFKIPVPFLCFRSNTITNMVTFLEYFGRQPSALVPFALLLFLCVHLIIFCISQLFDRPRIRKVIAASGGIVLAMTWTPFGRGWLLSRAQRIYRVTFRNRAGETVTGNCKTSMASGVNWIPNEGSPYNTASLVPPGSGVEVCPMCNAFILENGTTCAACGWNLQADPERKGNAGTAGSRLKTAIFGLTLFAFGGCGLYDFIDCGLHGETVKLTRSISRSAQPVQFWVQVFFGAMASLIALVAGGAIFMSGLRGNGKVSLLSGSRAKKGFRDE